MAARDGSGGGILTVTFAVEDWFQVKAEMLPLMHRHWEEIATDRDKIPLVVDFDSYDALAEAGILHVLIARKDGALIGYFWAFVKNHLHYAATLFAFTDILFLEKPHRKGRTGQKLIEAMEATLKARGVQKVFINTKTKLNLGPLFTRMGYGVHEVCYSKMIG